MSDTLVYALVKESTGERYVFLCDDCRESRQELMKAFGRFASDPNLSFSWYDAAHLAQTVMKSERKP